jgi:hypothetical protein
MLSPYLPQLSQQGRNGNQSGVGAGGPFEFLKLNCLKSLVFGKLQSLAQS